MIYISRYHTKPHVIDLNTAMLSVQSILRAVSRSASLYPHTLRMLTAARALTEA